MDWFFFVLHYFFRSVRVRDEALASDLMSLYMITQDHMRALELRWEWKAGATKPIIPHVRWYAY